MKAHIKQNTVKPLDKGHNYLARHCNYELYKARLSISVWFKHSHFSLIVKNVLATYYIKSHTLVHPGTNQNLLLSIECKVSCSRKQGLAHDGF